MAKILVKSEKSNFMSSFCTSFRIYMQGLQTMNKLILDILWRYASFNLKKKILSMRWNEVVFDFRSCKSSSSSVFTSTKPIFWWTVSLGWRGGSLGRVSVSRFYDIMQWPQFEPRQEHKKKIWVFPSRNINGVLTRCRCACVWPHITYAR